MYRCRETFEKLSPNIGALHESDKSGNVFGVIITMCGAGGAADYDFLSRYFAPWNGIPEDPVTGLFSDFFHMIAAW